MNQEQSKQKEKPIQQELIDKIKSFLQLDYGRLNIEKHQNQLYIEVTEKTKIAQ